MAQFYPSPASPKGEELKPSSSQTLTWNLSAYPLNSNGQNTLSRGRGANGLVDYDFNQGEINALVRLSHPSRRDPTQTSIFSLPFLPCVWIVKLICDTEYESVIIAGRLCLGADSRRNIYVYPTIMTTSFPIPIFLTHNLG